MSALVRRLRSEQTGMTLVELMVAMMILGIVFVIFGNTLSSVQRAVLVQDDLSRANDQARLAVEQVDRQMRSGNVLYDPGIETPPEGQEDTIAPYYTVRIYTQTNAETPTQFRCVQWTINTDRELMTRSWSPGQAVPVATPWRVVAEGIVNRELGLEAFHLDPDPLKGARTLILTLAVNENYDRHPSRTTNIQSSLTGRNTSYGYPVSVCSANPV